LAPKGSTRTYAFPVISRRRRPRTEVGLLIAALFGLLGGPCAMAFGAGIEPAAETPVTAHEGCPNDDSAPSMMDDTCCCLLEIAGGAGEATKPAAPALVSVIAVIPEITAPAVLLGTMAPPPRACLHETSPPVYLATRRLRI
jgi:hypothetical protein